MVDPGSPVLAALFLVAVLAGGIDAIAGGGGLLTIPALLMAGLDPASALGTNKLQGTIGALAATLAFARRGYLDRRVGLVAAGVAALAGIIGTLLVRFLPPGVLQGAVPILLIVIAVYLALRPSLRDTDARRQISLPVFCATLIPAVGCYDGLFGAGAGSFYMLGFVTLLGFGVVRATAHAKLANVASNLGSLATFILLAKVVWPIGLVMALGQGLGAALGARLAMRWGSRLIRPLLVTVSLLLAVKLLADPGNRLAGWVAAWWTVR